MLIRIRVSLMLAGLFYACAQGVRAQRMSLEIAIVRVEQKIEDTERRLARLEAMNSGERMARIEASLNANARAFWGLAVPVGLLAVSEFLKLLKARQGSMLR